MNDPLEVEQINVAEREKDPNPFTNEYFQNPYAFFRRAREQHPVLWVEEFKSWFITGYEEVEALLKDPRIIRDIDRVMPPEKETSVPEALKPLVQMQSNWMLFKDAPDHTRLRGFVNKAFTPQVVERLRPHMQDIAQELLATLREREEVDLIADFAYPLPVIVIAEMLGVPATDRHQFRNWSQQIVRTLDASVTQDDYVHGARATAELMGYLKQLVTERTKAPQHDLISHLIQAEEKGDRLSEDELLGTCALLLIAGHETTVNLIGNGMLTLLEHPAPLKKLQEEPDMLPAAIEEILRFQPPVQMVGRYAAEEIEIGGQRIEKGHEVNLVLAAANRDPRKFADPERFNITRTPNRHLSFASGPHFCVGAALARAEALIAFHTLLTGVATIERTTEEPNWAQSPVFRGLTSLPVRITFQ